MEDSKINRPVAWLPVETLEQDTQLVIKIVSKEPTELEQIDPNPLQREEPPSAVRTGADGSSGSGRRRPRHDQMTDPQHEGIIY